MLWNEIKTNWKTLAPKFKTKWAKLSDTDIKTIAGKRDELIDCITKIYKAERPKIEKELDEFARTLTLTAKA
ncbi:MAG: CsbD family protein [Planctomycetes bacterium]|nr:CsbD family protein [Planctomycetota bacterium]